MNETVFGFLRDGLYFEYDVDQYMVVNYDRKKPGHN